LDIFLSWSGSISQKVAIATKVFLRQIFPTTAPFLSSEDLKKGGQWSTDLFEKLCKSQQGIICLTKDNYEEPWLLFEAGALSKTTDKPKVWTLLLDDLSPEHLQGSPLSQFQHTQANKHDIEKLVIEINEILPTGKRNESELKQAFEASWTTFQSEIETALNIDLDQRKLIRLSDITTETNIIAGKYFRNAIIRGPGILFHMGNCTIGNCSFAVGDSIKSIIWQPNPSSDNGHIGAIGIYHTVFEDCIFEGVGFAGPDEFINKLLNTPLKS